MKLKLTLTVCLLFLGCQSGPEVENRNIAKSTKQPDVWWRRPVLTRERDAEWDKFNLERYDDGVSSITTVTAEDLTSLESTIDPAEMAPIQTRTVTQPLSDGVYHLPKVKPAPQPEPIPLEEF